MKYLIYTDGAHSTANRRISVGYIIKTWDTLITSGAAALDGDDISIAEALAIGVAVNSLLAKEKLDKKKDVVIIITDSLFAIEKFSNVAENPEKDFGNAKLNAVRDCLVKLSETCSWEFSKITSHMDTINCNKYADRMAKYFLQNR